MNKHPTALEKVGCPTLVGEKGPEVPGEGSTGGGCSIHTHPALSQKGSWPLMLLQTVPCLVQGPTKRPLLPDCRRPWRTWVDTSSWEDQAFFRRSGL